MKMPHFFRAIYLVLFQTQQLRKSPGKLIQIQITGNSMQTIYYFKFYIN